MPEPASPLQGVLTEAEERYWRQRFSVYKEIVHEEIKGALSLSVCLSLGSLCCVAATDVDLAGDVINCIRYHSRPEMLVAYCRDNALYLFSLRRCGSITCAAS